VTDAAVDAPVRRGEIDLLLAYLNYEREHVLKCLEGLDEVALRRPVLPSGWTCLGLVQHLALDVELFWFRAVIGGEQAAIDELATISNAWIVDDGATAQGILDRYRQEIERANAVIAATPLESEPAWWPEGLFGSWRIQDLRQVILHVMTETAVHAGHLDTVRELIDGKQYLVLTS
jgi:hypothetical protein